MGTRARARRRSRSAKPVHLAALTVIAAAVLSGCATNPVTGKPELTLVSEAQEIELGKENYAPSRQAQGGDFTIDPALNDYVTQVGRRVAAVSARPTLPYEFEVVNNGVPNAWALPGGKIAINRGLLIELENEAQLAAVLAHEIVHAAARHGAQNMERGMLIQGGVLATSVLTSGSALGGIATQGVGLALMGFNQKYGRDAELEADRYGMQAMYRAGYDPRAAVTLQEIFLRLSEGRQTGWLEGLFASHPPSSDRVAANDEEAKRLLADGAGTGELGTDRFLTKTKVLRDTKDAYEAYDKGQEALAKKDTNTALTLANQALAAEPREARFHGLRGDVRYMQGSYDDAVTNYDRAIDRDPSYYEHYLHRGMAKKQLGDTTGSRADLTRSMQLLPTKLASNELAQLAEQRGDRQGAIQHYRAAAGSDTEAGREASRALARLDLPSNPTRYLDLRTGLDVRGYVTLEIVNRAPVAVSDVDITITRLDGSGLPVGSSSLRLPGVLKAGSRTVRRTNIGPLAPEDLDGFRLTLVGAQPASD